MVALANAILDATRFRRDLFEASELERTLARTIYERADARRLGLAAGLLPELIDDSGPPSTFWARILDVAAGRGRLGALLAVIAAEPIHPTLERVIAAVRAATAAGAARTTRLLLGGNRPFLNRKALRELLPELQDWQSSAAVLVVRGPARSGRSETQALIDDIRVDGVEAMVVLDETMSLSSSMRQVWVDSGVGGAVPVTRDEPLTTESAVFIDFWTDVRAALERNNRRLWVLVDDLDKGPGRVDIRTLAEVLAIRLRAIPFQRRFRLVLLGYPDAEPPRKVPAAVVRNDFTEALDDSHVAAFLDYCLTSAGKQFDPASLPDRAAALCRRAHVHVAAEAAAGRIAHYADTLNGMLCAWHRSEIG